MARLARGSGMGRAWLLLGFVGLLLVSVVMVQVDSVPQVTAESSESFVPLSPVRVLNTRGGAKVGNAAGTGAPYVLKVLGQGGVPASGVGAVALNVTVTQTEDPTVGGGYVTVYPCGTLPDASNLNFVGGQTIPNSVIAPVSASGEVCFYVYGTAHLLADVSGYFPAGSGFSSLSPVRVLNTRGGEKVGNAAGTGAPYVLNVLGKGGVPASGVGAVALNVTVTQTEDPTVGGGYVTVYPCGTLPDASNLNFVGGQTIPNSVIAPVSASGDVCFYVYGTAHLLADVSGYFPAGSGFSSLSPVRVLNTRGGEKVGNAAGTGAPYVLNVLGKGGVPASGVGAVALNVTVTQTEDPTVGGGYVTVYPCGTLPDASNLNFVGGQTIPNSVIAPVSASGEVCFYVYGTAHLLADVSGYFPTATPPSTTTPTTPTTTTPPSSTTTTTTTVPPVETQSVIHRVNAGGPTVAATDGGPDWLADSLNPTWYGSGTKAATIVFAGRDATVPVSAPQSLFHTHRYGNGGPMSWNIPVPTGEPIEVRLYLGDGFAGTSDPGARVFAVAIDGTNAFGSIDLAANPGSQIGTMKSFKVVSDGNLDLDFTASVQNPLVNAIEIVSAETQPSTLSVAPSTLDFGNVAVGGTASQTLTLRNLGGSGDPSIQVTGVAVSGTGASAISTNFAGPLTLAAGASAAVEVTYDPPTVGSVNGQISIAHNGTNSPVVVPVVGQAVSNVPVAFSKKTVVNGLTNITTLDWGPDDRLYTAQQDGTIKIFDLVRSSNGTYSATATETINLVKNLPNRTDLGVPRVASDRLVTGLVTAGTPSNPIIYVGSSDPRIAVNDDTGETDTNSGILSRLTWTGSTWDHDQLIRGLPRSEENHTTNGLVISGTKLFVAQGGNTNMGAPSSNFGETPEFALSAAILEIELTHPQLASGQYDLPTLDDPDRPGTNDANDPFGGNDGKNMAIWDPAGPVQVYSGGWRNIYDLVIAQSGKMYTIDNGPNGGWGGEPLLDNPADEFSCNNDKNDGGLSLQDNLHYVTGEGYYGGHPNPVRGNASNFPGAVPVGLIDPQECVYLTPGVEDGALATFPFSTNGVTEYTASNFGGAMQGDLLAANFKGTVKRIQLNGSGTGVVNNGITDLATAIPNALDVVAQGDNDPFPGTVWVASYGADSLVVLEPSDYGSGGGTPSCTGQDSLALDEDEDGYSNADEIDNGTNPCSAASLPTDFDDDGVSDLNDPDDDQDGLADVRADPIS